MQAATDLEINAIAATDLADGADPASRAVAPALEPSAGGDMLELLLATAYCGCEPASVQVVLRYCQAAGLDPLRKPLQVVPMRDPASGELRMAVVPGIGLYRTIAARCGCAGVDEPEFGPEATEGAAPEQWTYPLWCRVTVRRRLATGEIVAFTAREFWRENAVFAAQADGSAQPNDIWRRRPYGQLAKCAEAQALRKAFPEIGAQPVAEELEDKSLPTPAEAPRSGHRGRSPIVRMPMARAPAGGERATAAACAADGPECAWAPSPTAQQPDPADAEPDCATGLNAPAPASSELSTGRGAAPANEQQAAPPETSRPPHAGSQRSPGASGNPDAGPFVDLLPVQPDPARAPEHMLATAGERAYIERRIGTKGLTIAAARRLAGLGEGLEGAADLSGDSLDSLDGLTRAEFVSLLKVSA